MRTKDIHFLCPSKPFVRDNTEGICGLESIRPDTSCPAEATPRSQVEVTQAEIIGNRWLVNTPARTATLTYDQHDTATRIILPNQTLWITVPKGSILHIDELALYHLTDDEYQAEIEISPFFKQHSFILDPELEERIKEEGTQLIDLTPVDTALEAIARLPPAGVPIIRSWSAADTALCISTIVGYVVTLTLAFLLHKRVNAVQESFNKCTSGVPRIFRRHKPTKNPNLRTQPTCLRSRLYRLVEPLTIKPIGMTQLPVILKNAPLHLLKFLTCSFPNCPAPGFGQ